MSDSHSHEHAHAFDQQAAKESYGRITFYGIILAVLTLVEFILALNSNSLAGLMILALLKAVIVLNYFMHMYRLWRDDDHGHEGGHH